LFFCGEKLFGISKIFSRLELSMNPARLTLAEINPLSREDFTRTFGGLFEHSPWIAELTWSKRPFASLEKLHEALCQTVSNASENKQLALIRAHPDLVGRAALAGTLTRESTNEQTSAGLNQLTPEEIETFKKFNTAYREKFGLPFVICARLNKKDAILNGFRVRLNHSREQEIKTALEEIFKIAELRLRDLTHD
jgi:2-oxo-4-hydroxy-4-carboxy-5-ureidoimidazoline decarboxylase